MRAIYIAKGSPLLPPAFASIFDDLASSSLDVFFDPSTGLLNVPGVTLGISLSLNMLAIIMMITFSILLNVLYVKKEHGLHVFSVLSQEHIMFSSNHLNWIDYVNVQYIWTSTEDRDLWFIVFSLSMLYNWI